MVELSGSCLSVVRLQSRVYLSFVERAKGGRGVSLNLRRSIVDRVGFDWLFSLHHIQAVAVGIDEEPWPGQKVLLRRVVGLVDSGDEKDNERDEPEGPADDADDEAPADAPRFVGPDVDAVDDNADDVAHTWEAMTKRTKGEMREEEVSYLEASETWIYVQIPF